MQDSAVARVEGFGSRRFSRSHLFVSPWPVRNSASASLKKGFCLAFANFDRLAVTVQAAAKESKPPPVATTLNNPSAMEVKRSPLATRCPSSVSWLRGIALKCGYLKLFAFWAKPGLGTKPHTKATAEPKIGEQSLHRNVALRHCAKRNCEKHLRKWKLSFVKRNMILPIAPWDSRGALSRNSGSKLHQTTTCQSDTT